MWVIELWRYNLFLNLIWIGRRKRYSSSFWMRMDLIFWLLRYHRFFKFLTVFFFKFFKITGFRIENPVIFVKIQNSPHCFHWSTAIFIQIRFASFVVVYITTKILPSGLHRYQFGVRIRESTFNRLV